MRKVLNMNSYEKKLNEKFLGKKADIKRLRRKLRYNDDSDGSYLCYIENTRRDYIYTYCYLKVLVDETNIVRNIAFYTEIDYGYDRYAGATEIVETSGYNYSKALEIMRYVVPEIE